MIGKRRQNCFPSAHGKARDRRTFSACRDGIIILHKWHQARYYLAPREIVDGGEVGRVPIGLSFARIEQAVHAYDHDLGRALEIVRVARDILRVHGQTVDAVRPGRVVAVEPVQEIEHGIALARVIARGQNDRRVSVRPRDGGAIGDALDLAIGISLLEARQALRAR